MTNHRLIRRDVGYGRWEDVWVPLDKPLDLDIFIFDGDYWHDLEAELAELRKAGQDGQ